MKQNFLQTLSLWKKHKVLSVLLGMVILCLLLFLAWYFQPIPTRTITGEINGRSFSMEVPKDWEHVTDSTSFQRYAPPGEAYTEKYVSIDLAHLSEELSYSEQSQELLRQMILTGDPSQVEQAQQILFPDFRISSHKKVQYHGIPMVRLSYALCKDPEWGNTYTISYFFEQQGSVYSLHLSWEEYPFWPMSRILQKSASSFQWK